MERCWTLHALTDILQVSSGSPVAVKTGQRFRNRDDFNGEFAKATMPKFARYGQCVQQPTMEALALTSPTSGLSKLALISWTKELQRRLKAEHIPIIVTAPCPGLVHTGTA